MKNDTIIFAGDVQMAIEDWKQGLYSSEEFENKMYKVAAKLLICQQEMIREERAEMICEEIANQQIDYGEEKLRGEDYEDLRYAERADEDSERERYN